MSGEHILDFVQRLATQIRGLQELVFRSLDQIADIVNIFYLQAVGRTNGQFQIVDQTEQNRIQGRRCFFLLGLFGFRFGLDGSENRELVLKNAHGTL